MERSPLEISLDKLPVKRLDAIEENGLERFPSYDVGYEEKRESLIRRIDFAWAVQKEDKLDEVGDKDGDNSSYKERAKKKRQIKDKESSAADGSPWPWRGMVENLQLAQQELIVIMDLINTAEVNDAVAVAGMTRPKPLTNETLADCSVSVATKLQCYRKLGKYFKRSAEVLEQQVAREAKFYGALIRLQQNWKIKRQRITTNISSSDGFFVDLSASALYDVQPVSGQSALTTVRIERDSSGMLAIKLPPKSCQRFCFGFVVAEDDQSCRRSNKCKTSGSVECLEGKSKESETDEHCVKSTHSLLREIHQTIFAEQVFEMLTHEAFNQSLGFSLTGLRENYLRLSIGAQNSVFVSLIPYEKGKIFPPGEGNNCTLSMGSLEQVKHQDNKRQDDYYGRISPLSSRYEIYIQQLFHEKAVARSKGRSHPPNTRSSAQSLNDGSGLLSHFCLSLEHAMFSLKVLSQIETVVCKVPYLHLVSHQTWHSRTSSWTVVVKVPQSILHSASHQSTSSGLHSSKNVIKSEFRTKIVVNDDCITVEAEGVPNILSLFKGTSKDLCSVNKFNSDLANLSVIVMEQVASQVISWLHEEALMVGIKANRDFLRLSFELEQGEILSLAAQVDSDDYQGCICWWLIMEDSFTEERKQLYLEEANASSPHKKFLGYLSLDVLYSTFIDLVSLCNGRGTL